MNESWMKSIDMKVMWMNSFCERYTNKIWIKSFIWNVKELKMNEVSLLEVYKCDMNEVIFWEV